MTTNTATHADRDANNRRWSRKFRTIRGENANYRVAYYKSRAARDHAAQRDADHDGQAVLLECWDGEHPQDELNQGWACDGVAESRGDAQRIRNADADCEAERTLHGGQIVIGVAPIAPGSRQGVRPGPHRARGGGVGA